MIRSRFRTRLSVTFTAFRSVRGSAGRRKPKPARRTIGKRSKPAIKGKLKKKPLSEITDKALKRYLKSLNGHDPANLYQLVIGEVERPLLKNAVDYAGGNKSQAAKILGINRGTLRKKLKFYDLLEE